jgi:SPASM domain peptide maturase of grasp-with-spasm system
MATVAYHPDAVTSATHCGYVHPAYFVTSLPLFTESQRHNSCLNRKLSVDEHGQVRNCPAMPRSFGPARAVRLADVVRLAEFREPWALSKDQVEVCRDCEFRHVCTDCRALLADPANPRSKPARCGYDPYTATWARPPAPGQLTTVSTGLPVRRAAAVRELVPA